TARKLVVLAAVFIAWSLTASIQAGADEIACRFEQQLSCNASAGETEIISFYKAENSHVVQTDAQYKTPSGEPVSVNPGGPGGKICCTSFAAPVQVKPSCDAGYSALFSVYKTTSNNVVENSHVGLPGNTAPYKLCAKTTQGVSQTSCAPKTACDEASDEWPLFSVYSSAFDERGSHVAKKEASTGYKWCCSNTQTLNADPNAVCNNNGDCETALGENAGNCIADCAETNLHIGCSAPDASGTLQEAPCRVDCSRMFCDSLQSLQTISKLAEKKFEEAKKDGKYDDDAHLKSKGWVDKTKIGDEGRTYQLPISFDVFTMEDTLSNNTLKDVNVYSRKAAGLTMTKLLSSEWTGFEWLSTKGSDTIGTGMYLVDSSSVTESCENKKDLCLKLKIKDTPNELKCGKKKVVLAMEIFIAQNGTTARRAVATIEHVNDSETGKKCDSYPYLHLPLDAPLLDEYFKASGSVFKKTETDPAKNDPDPDVGVKVSLKTDLTGDAGALADFRRLELLTGPLMAEKYPNLLLNAASTTLKTLSNRPAGAKGVPVEAGVIDSFKTGFYFQAGTSGTPHAPLLLMPRYNPTRARITATGNVSLHPS
ncbi:MAG TPA: hypothetical protein VJI67_03380, partial [archaeon]|nr:hypothetical protein [archaeon]